MGQPGAFLTIERHEHGVKPACEAVRDFEDFSIGLPPDEQRDQASRCMNCGVPFCQSGIPFNGGRHATGCPLHNLIPETNDLLYRKRWDDAAARLTLTNPFPEFTGRVCPAPCETACNLGLHDAPVTIHDNERALSDYLWEHGMQPLPTARRDAPLASVVGSGPAGLAAAWELTRLGWRVRVYERDERPGGLLTYGIPNMKLPKEIVKRRIELMGESGIEFVCNVDATSKANEICTESDAVILACGCRTPRRLEIPGMHLDGIHYAVEYLSEATRAVLDGRASRISAEGKHVVVIGGGDTGVDCVATALRQNAQSVRQVIRAKRPVDSVDTLLTWPGPRNVYTQSYGQREAAELFGEDPRIWATDTVSFIGDDAGAVSAVVVCPIPEGEPYELQADLVLIAKGFTGPETATLDAFNGFENVHLAGDARLGSTLVATAIADAVQVAQRLSYDTPA